MHTKLIDPITDPRWDKFVESHPFGWVCHLSGWKRVLEESFRHMKGYYFVLVDENDDIKAGLPIYEVKSWLTGKRLVSIPFATLCDPLISTNDDMKKLFESAFKLKAKLKSSFIEIRTFQSVSVVDDDRLSQVKHYKNHYLSLKRDLKQIKNAFHRKTVRQSVNRAMKSDLKLIVADQESGLLSFYKLYVHTRKNIGLPPQPYIFFKMLWDTFFPNEQMSLLLAEKNKQIIAGVIIFKFKNRVSAEYAAWDRHYSKTCPNHFLYWNVIKMAHHEGYEIFDLGRTSPSSLKLMEFKRRWGTQLADLPQLYYPEPEVNKGLNREASLSYKTVSTIVPYIPGTWVTTFGKLCYRHLG